MNAKRMAVGAGVLVAAAAAVGVVLGNGGPFVVKYPAGDPAAKGVLARLDPDLRPGRITNLRVLKEDLKVEFTKDLYRMAGGTALVKVTAAYTIENPNDQTDTVDFGFPILRGIFMSPQWMMPTPDVHVTMSGRGIRSTIISNSSIYGLIRRRSREVIDKGLAADAKLGALVAAVKAAKDAEREPARSALSAHLTGAMKWNERDAALLVEYAGLDLGTFKVQPRDAAYGFWFLEDQQLVVLARENLGPLGAIGEQKATQCLAQLASKFDPKAAAAYEAIFTAWGGDVRERSIDLKTGQVRPREVTVDLADTAGRNTAAADPTIYARVDYFDETAKISEAEKAACKSILKNLPVVFTFAPMNLLHYQAAFPAKSTQTLTVTYSQYAYLDTKEPASYQVAYVVHPASMWDTFGPINLEVVAPAGVEVRASVPLEKAPASNRATLTEKTGELFLAVDAAAWTAAVSGKPAAPRVSPVGMMPAAAETVKPVQVPGTRDID